MTRVFNFSAGPATLPEPVLRQAADVDSTDQTVTGKTAGALLRFVGDTLEAGQAVPTNPNGGGSGVIIMGFSANDTNRLTFYDNTATARRPSICG